MYLADGVRRLRDRGQVLDDELMREKTLVDNLHDALIASPQPDGLKVLPADFHRGSDVRERRRRVNISSCSCS